MTNKRVFLQWMRKFLFFYYKAHTVYDVHSPFISEFIREVIQDKRHFYAFPIIEGFRNELLQNETPIRIDDLGAGSRVNAGKTRLVKDVVKHAAISRRTGRRLFRLVNWQKPLKILELGTSLGISTLYQASASLNAQVITIEGCKETADLATQNFRRLGLPWLKVVNAPFDQAITNALTQLGQVDYFFLDGNHREKATLQYFDSILPYAHPETIVVIADIYWSGEMERAWKKIIDHPKVTLSIDLFDIGIVFFREVVQSRQHFRLVPARWKPWRLGLF